MSTQRKRPLNEPSQRLQPTATPTQLRRHDDLIILHKNARSLCSDDHIDELLTELQHTTWDIIAINETWRTHRRELWTTKDEHHLFAGSGYDTATRGVAFLVHKSLASNVYNFNAINERIAYLDIKVRTWKFRIVTAYFPHSGYSDACVQNVYDTLSTITEEARAQHLHIVITGDFNAQVGKRNDDDNTTTLGPFALEPSNSRGDWLTSWATSQHLVITNTYFDKPPSDIATYYSPTQKPRQIDYILTNKTLWKRVRDAHSTKCPDLGSDHRAVRLRLDLHDIHPKKSQRQAASTRQQTQHWPPADYNDFRSTIEREFDRKSPTNDLNDRCATITTALNNAAQQHASNPQITSHARTPQHDKLLQLIKDRQQLPHNSPGRKTASLAIRKLLQHIRRHQREEKIQQVILNRRGLRHIADIKRNHARILIPSMTTREGTTTTDRQSIADVFATFYEDLYKCRSCEDTTTDVINPSRDQRQDIRPFSLEEVSIAINQLRNGRCKDTTGLIAEMLKAGGPTLHSQLQRLFNDVISPDATPPTQWKQTTISVIHKSGDPQLPSNYRPIAIIPLLYKLFARLLYNRLAPLLDAHQTPDQAGF